jgi:hypothetical protein
MSILNTKIQFRNDISTNWESVNPILDTGEGGYDYEKGVFKVGDGVTPWNDLEGIGTVEEENTFSFPYPGGTLVDGQDVSSASNKVIAEQDIIYALGTNFGTSSYTNPISSNKISKIYDYNGLGSNFLNAFDRLKDSNSTSSYFGAFLLCNSLTDPGIIKITDYLYKPTTIFVQTVNSGGFFFDAPKSLTFTGVRTSGSKVNLVTASGLSSSVDAFNRIDIITTEYFDKIEITSPNGNDSRAGGSEILLYGDLQLR